MATGHEPVNGALAASASHNGARATKSGAINIGKIVRSESHVRYTCQVFGAGEIAAPPQPENYAFGAFVRVPLRAGPATTGQLALPDVAASAPQSPFAPGRPRPADTAPNTAHDTAPDPAYGSLTGEFAVGLIYDTILLNPAFGVLGPRLSNDEQVEVFSPDYLAERAVLVSILLLGTMSYGSYGSYGGVRRVSHGVPPLAPDLGAVIWTLPEDELRAFHYFADSASADTLAMLPAPRSDVADSSPNGTPAARPYLHMGYLPHAVAQDNPLLPMAMLRTIERLEALFPQNRALLSIVKRNFAWRLKVQTAG
ncbi:MAG: hypothetical protein ABI068_18275 [Ktedonobacterales bacterium]